MRQLRGTGSFDVHIAKILKRNSTVPLIRYAEGNRTLPADEYYKLLTTITQILREEYLQKMMHAKIELEKRFLIFCILNALMGVCVCMCVCLLIIKSSF